MNIPENLFYTKEHEWARIENGEAFFGITDYAQSMLSDIVYLDLPEVGRQVKQFEAYGAVEAVKAASDIYAPLSGEIISVNEAVKAEPGLVNRDPYGDGWLVKVKLSDPNEKANLMSAADYSAYIATLEH
ncbi:MAG: glycine cleavage system protein GcvH [candidate division WOR-3 bacterium]